MFDFGDDLFIGSHRIPWLVWIQLIVMLLLVILLYYFIAFALGLDPSPAAGAASSSAVLRRSETSRHRPLPIATAVSAATAASSRLNTAKAGESHSIRGDAGTSTSRRRVRREEIQEREGSSSAKDATDAPALDRYYHPCHYLGWARQAFLKCLGLDPPSSNPSSNTRHRKEK
ncbi:uncharacterized protein LOC131304343 [Rhododendron vialii]|uniref:uncharacterized protein LOC131304343 n=1 Tax=Rhododendron vialii TaxID=182163 RepID=UPI00266026C4|nr:uncharacterized protein LOC131304343 [Rhododendron vialii]